MRYYLNMNNTNGDGTMTTGTKYNKDQSLKEIAKMVRKELKRFGKGFKFSVRTQLYSGGQSLNVTVKAVPAGFIVMNEQKIREEIENPSVPSFANRYAADASAMLDEIKAIARDYNFDKSDSMVDYFHVNFYTHIDFDHDLQREGRQAIMATM